MKSQEVAGYLFLLLCVSSSSDVSDARATIFWHASLGMTTSHKKTAERVGKPFFKHSSSRGKHKNDTCSNMKRTMCHTCSDSSRFFCAYSEKFHKCPIYDLTFQTFFLLHVNCCIHTSQNIFLLFSASSVQIYVKLHRKRFDKDHTDTSQRIIVK